MPFKNNKVRKSFSLEEATRLILSCSPMTSEENGGGDFGGNVDDNLARGFGEENGRGDFGGNVDENLARGFGEENGGGDFGAVVDENLVRDFGGNVDDKLARDFGKENGLGDFGGYADENLARGFGGENGRSDFGGVVDENVASVAFKFLNKTVRDTEHVTIWCDNCSGQNKNWTLYSLLVYCMFSKSNCLKLLL